MSGPRDPGAAAAAALLGSDEDYRVLLRAIVQVARAIFGARASSILLLDREEDELVFEAVVGEGEERLLGMRFPADRGVAGWVLATRQPLILEDAERDPRFARDVAIGTGYIPRGLMAVPLLRGEDAIGVLEVLDRPGHAAFSLREMDLLGLFAGQAAIAVDLLLRARQAKAVLGGGPSQLGRLAAALDGLEGARRATALQLLDSLTDVLGG